MAQTNKPFGFRPARTITGANWNGAVTKYVVLAAATLPVFVGDLVYVTGSGSAEGLREIARVNTAQVSGNVAVGVVVGFEPVSPSTLDVSNSFRASGAQAADRVAYVVDDPNMLFEVQEDAAGGAIAVASLGLNVDLIPGTPGTDAGTTASGRSKMMIDSSGVGATAERLLKLVEVVQAVDNTAATSFARYLVKINQHQYGNATAGV